MFLKAILLFLIVSFSLAEEKDGNVLIFKDPDFQTDIHKKAEYLLVMFYASWCGHCQKFLPVYSQLADQFVKQGLTIKLAKVDQDIKEEIQKKFEVTGYPKLLFFFKGQQIHYKGQRNKQHLKKWLLKIIEDKPLPVLTKQQYQTLKSTQRTTSDIILHASPSSQHANIIRYIARQDTYNNFYIAEIGQSDGSVEMLRPFDTTVILDNAFLGADMWIKENQKQIVVPFDDKTVERMFNKNQTAICLFNTKDSEQLLQAFTQSAVNYHKQGKKLLFANVQGTGEHIYRFSNFLKVFPSKVPIVVVEPSQTAKYILRISPKHLNTSVIDSFLNDWSNGNIKKLQIDQDTTKDKPKQQVKKQENKQAQQQEESTQYQSHKKSESQKSAQQGQNAQLSANNEL